MIIKYTKLDIVRQQIEAAIILFFDQSTPVPIHTLAHASETILYDLSKKDDGDFAFNRDIYIKEGCEKQFYNHYNQYANFFKHADKENGKVKIEFQDEINDISLMNCCIGYKEISGTLTKIMTVYVNWFMIFYPECFKLPCAEQDRVNILKELFESEFNLENIDRRRKKLIGKALLKNAKI